MKALDLEEKRILSLCEAKKLKVLVTSKTVLCWHREHTRGSEEDIPYRTFIARGLPM